MRPNCKINDELKKNPLLEDDTMKLVVSNYYKHPLKQLSNKENYFLTIPFFEGYLTEILSNMETLNVCHTHTFQ